MTLHRLALVLCLGVALHARAAPFHLDEERHAHFYAPVAGEAVPRAPQRIISLAPIVTETLFAVGAGGRVVGVTRFCDRPAAAQALPKVGGYTDPQLEAMLALRPDLVIAMPSFGQRTVLDALRSRGVPVLVGFGDTFDEMRDLLRAIGRAVDAGPQGEALTVKLDAQLARVAARAKTAATHPRTVIVVSTSPLVVAGPGTFANEAIPIAGGTSIVALTAPAWPVWSLETLAASKPNVVVTAEGPAGRAALEPLLGRAWSRARACC